jgi:hypothetical protein
MAQNTNHMPHSLSKKCHFLSDITWVNPGIAFR